MSLVSCEDVTERNQAGTLVVLRGASETLWSDWWVSRLEVVSTLEFSSTRANTLTAKSVGLRMSHGTLSEALVRASLVATLAAPVTSAVKSFVLFPKKAHKVSSKTSASCTAFFWLTPKCLYKNSRSTFWIGWRTPENFDVSERNTGVEPRPLFE